MTPEKRQTFTLCIVLIILLIVLLMLVLALGNTFIISIDNTFIIPIIQNKPINPNELSISEGMSLHEAKTILDANKITYSIIPTQSRVPNRVEKIEYSSTKITLYANEIGKDKVVYLTFDDGPTRDNTYEILDKLQNYGIKASFFVEGADVDRYPERMETTFARGHIIACHSYSHQLDVIYSSTDEFIKEIRQYEQAMIDAIGEENFASMQKIIRFPGGTNNAKLNKTKSLEYIAKVREIGYSVYDWTVLTGDAEGASDTATFISNLSSGLERAKNNELHLIVLMHDKWSTNEALNDILAYLVSEGYYFDTIDNCPEYTFVEN